MAKRTRPETTTTLISAESKGEAQQQPTSQTHSHSHGLTAIQNDEDQLPLYSREQPNALQSVAKLATTIRNGDNFDLPILAYPPLAHNGMFSEDEPLRHHQLIVNMYFNAIEGGSVERVAAFYSAGLVTTETTNEQGRTPLLAAVEAKHTHMSRYLLNIGADINAYGIIATTILGYRNEQHTYRTPLQFAAQNGNLPIVKLLVERGADDALIAPDGELALRLAASNGHREVVDYLPSRRGGGFRRWKAKHAKAMTRCKKAAHGIYIFGKFFWDVPKFFLWSVPKHVLVLPFVQGIKWLHEHRREIPKIMANAAKDVAIAMKKFPMKVWQVLKKMPRAIWEAVKDCARSIWRSIKRAPHGMKIALIWLWAGLKRSGLAVGNIIGRFFSLIHTLCAAVATFFQRITFRDVIHAFLACCHAITVDAPKKIWKWMCTFGKTSLKVLEAVFGWWGECIWILIYGILAAVTYVPKRIWQILVACGSSIRSGGKEMLVFIDPKRV